MPPDSPLPDPLPSDMSEQLLGLGSQLVWRIGKAEGQEGIIVRVGYASTTPHFALLPKLRSANDTELGEALRQNAIHIEWVD